MRAFHARGEGEHQKMSSGNFTTVAYSVAAVNQTDALMCRRIWHTFV